MTLQEQGYRCISRAHRIVARIDRPDWKEHMARMATPWDEAEGLRWVELLGRMAPDYYRRVYSRDRVVLPFRANRFPSSSGDTTGYVPLERDLERKAPKSGVKSDQT